MRQWLEAGYFKGDLPISQQSSGPFLPLSALYPDLEVAFRALSQGLFPEEGVGRTVVEDETKRKIAGNEDRRAAEAAAHAEQARVEAAERERIGTERQVAEAQSDASREAIASTSGIESSSAQLKMMLGLSPNESKDENKESNVEELGMVEIQVVGTELSKGSKQDGSMPIEVTPDSSMAGKTVSSSPAWGGAASTKSKKSMSEIQQEEARAAALMAMQRDGEPRQSSNGWANVAASGKSGWSSGTLKPTPSATGQNSGGVGSTRSPQGNGKAQQNVTRKASPISQQQRSSSTASSTPAEEFGTTMSPGLEKWCKDQMEQINGSDDLTLVAFCMTLDDASEIRQYLTTYLGSTSQVNNFATEFISKRGLGNRQEEWETPGSAKKGRKKKNGGR